jgi:SAM-dependent methyltransferase
VTGAARRTRPRPSSRRPQPTDPGASGPSSPAHLRFLHLERERATREWLRYEGTAQRDLFRQLRERFLHRHAREGRWALDAGSGPGRFSPWLGGPSTRRVALDLSLAMLTASRGSATGLRRPPEHDVERVRGDALRPPFPPAGFAEVALIGNALGFEHTSGEELLSAVETLVAPGGRLVLEVAPGPGERSRYLGRLPPGAVRRLLAAPPKAVLPRVEREGFAEEPARHRPAAFRRWTAKELHARWSPPGWVVRETMAVAPALGADAARLAEVARDPAAWLRLTELEEAIGRDPRRWRNAAAVLLAVEHPPSVANDIVRERPSFRA